MQALLRQTGALAPVLALEPHQFFRSSSDVKEQLRVVLADVAHVYTQGFDAEQIWEQLQLRVRPASAPRPFVSVV